MTQLMIEDTKPDANIAAFWDRAAAKYAASPVNDPAAYEQKLHRLTQLTAPSDTVLEIGCGTGSTALILAPGVKRYIATDISDAMVEIARDKLSELDVKQLEFRREAADHVLAEEAFDVVFASSLLHLVDDIPGVLQSAMRQLKPGGLFISKTVCIADGSWFLRPLIAIMTMIGFAPKVAVLSEEDIVSLIEEAGFSVIEISHFSKKRMSPFVVAMKPS